MLAVCDENGQQISELQGRYTRELHERIAMEALPSCIWHGFEDVPFLNVFRDKAIKMLINSPELVYMQVFPHTGVLLSAHTGKELVFGSDYLIVEEPGCGNVLRIYNNHDRIIFNMPIPEKEIPE
jgi:hypothetical protein